MVGEHVALLVDALLMADGTFAVFVEGSVFRTSLTEAHVQYFRDKQLYLIVCQRDSLIEQLPGFGIVHTNNRDESKIIKGFSTSVVISIGQGQGATGIDLRRVNIAVVKSVGK